MSSRGKRAPSMSHEHYHRTLTLKKIRQDLAAELGVDEAVIKQHKECISSAVDEVRIVLFVHRYWFAILHNAVDTDCSMGAQAGSEKASQRCRER